MARVTLQEFAQNRSLLALRLSSADLAGLLRKSITIPPRTAGLASFADGTSALFQAGREVSGKFELLLAKEGDIQARFVFADLRASDGFPLAATCSIALSIATSSADLFKDFARRLFNFPGAYGTAELKSHVAPEVRRRLADYAAARPAAELHRTDHSTPVAAELQESLDRFLFDGGVRYLRLLELSFVSAAWEERAAGEKKRIDDVRRDAEVLDRKEERVRRLAGILKDQEVQGLLTRVPDERLKALLYAKLMEDDAVQLSAEELISKAKGCGEEVVQVIYKAMENLLSTGASVSPDEVEGAMAGRILVAAGRSVFEIDPASTDEPRVIAFPEPLRSIRAQGPLLLGGSKTCVTALPASGEGPPVFYPLPGAAPVKGGVNAIAATQDLIFATHSERGLVRWSVDRPGEAGETLYEELTSLHRTTRAVQLLDDRRILFASGQHLYLAPAEADRRPVKFVSSIESPVTCVAAAARTIFAGTESGVIVCWKADAPDQPVVIMRQRDPIMNLRLARICALPHLLYSTRDLSIRARVIGQNLETAYESDGRAVGVLDAASDIICASDSEGRRILWWKSTAPARPAGEIDFRRRAEKPILDLWMKKVRVRSA